jgi:hypothetical protein
MPAAVSRSRSRAITLRAMRIPMNAMPAIKIALFHHDRR